MSKTCILVVAQKNGNKSNLRKEIDHHLTKYGLAAFFSVDYYEPIINYFQGNSIVCCIADSHEYNNCEMLLLPDNCSINGIKNEVSFIRRMEMLASLIKQISSLSRDIELFFGESGDELDDFYKVVTTTDFFPVISERLYNSGNCSSLHFIFVNT